MSEYKLEKLKLKLKTNWKISRGESLYKYNYILSFGDYISEIAPNIRYGESQEVVERNFKEFIKNPNKISPYWANCFKNAVENLKLKIKYEGDLFNGLGLNKVDNIMSSFSIPIMDHSMIGPYLKENNQFHVYKLKIDQENALSLIDEVSKHTDKPLRVDANEAFYSFEQYLDFESKLAPYNIDFIEQPFKAKMIEFYKELKKVSRYEIIADESVLDHFDEKLFPTLFCGVNVKLMKTGGLLKAKEILTKAKKYKMKTMVGCMIETSVGISEAMVLSSLCDYIDLDGSLLLDKDPYDLIKLDNGYLSLKN